MQYFGETKFEIAKLFWENKGRLLVVLVRIGIYIHSYLFIMKIKTEYNNVNLIKLMFSRTKHHVKFEINQRTKYIVVSRKEFISLSYCNWERCVQ